MCIRDRTFQLCREYVDEIVTVREDEIASAILALKMCIRDSPDTLRL